MSKGIVETIAGGALIAAGVAMTVLSVGTLASVGVLLIEAGAGLLLTGVGTMLSKGPLGGFATSTRNPIAPWEVVYGRSRVGGTIVYISEFGENNKFLDLVVVLAAHQCLSVDELLFDNQRVQIGAHNSAFTPVQQTLNIRDIRRLENVITVTLLQDIPLLSDGDRVRITHNNGGGILDSYRWTGTFPVTIVGRGFFTSNIGGVCALQFTYLSSGDANPGHTGPVDNEGQVETTWTDYKSNVYLETMGDSGPYSILSPSHPLGTTFQGMTNGTPRHGDSGDLVTPENESSQANPWTSDCSLVGMTAAFIRLQYDQKLFPGGIPQISFLVRGKNDIFDPRSSTNGYTENAALCIADYINNNTWGFKAVYGTEINTPNLIAAANICDEPVGLSFPFTTPLTTEPRYTCCGKFNLSMKRGEVLQNLLTSCAGRITYTGGLFSIWPAHWTGSSLTLPSSWVSGNSAGPIKWRSTVSISNLYNGVKGTYISPVNNWQSADFPRYAQDPLHGYSEDDNLISDGGDRRWLDVQFPFTISCPTAQRLAKIELMRRRQQGTGTFLLNMAGYQIATLDVIQMSLAYFGWTNKYLEVLATRFKIDKQQNGDSEVVLLGVEIDVQETDPSVYDWEIIEELSPQGYQHPGVPDSVLKPDPPSNLRFSFNDSGDSVLNWTAPQDAYVTTIEGRYQLITSPEGIWISLGTVSNSVTQITLPVLLAGEQYVMELRSLNGAGVASDWVSINYTPVSLPPQWAPYQVQADATDALFPNEYTFDVNLSYLNQTGDQRISADGGVLERATVIGVKPVNVVIPDCDPPIITGASVTATGGHIPGGILLYCTVTAEDSSGTRTLPAAVFPVNVSAGTNTNSVTLSVTWPDFAGLVTYTVYASQYVDLICAQEWGAALTFGGSPAAYSPASLTLAGLTVPPSTFLARSTWNPPNPNLRFIRLKGTVCYHAGILGAAITSISGNTIVSSDCIDLSLTDDWTGRALMVIGRDGDFTPFWSRTITSYDPGTGTFHFAASVVGPQAGDVFAVTTKGSNPGGDQYRLQDTGWSNSTNYDFATHASTPHSGLTVNLEAKMVARVISGKSRGLKANVLSNTSDTHVLDAPIPVDSTSVWIIVESGWPYSMDSTPFDNNDPFFETQAILPLDNFNGQSMFLAPVLVDFRGTESDDGDGPMRIAYGFGAGWSKVTVTGDYQAKPSDQIILVDSTSGAFTVTLPNKNSVRSRQIVVKKISADTNPVTIVGASGQPLS